VADPPIAAVGLAVHLRWDVSVDLDLYVTDPAGETFYYGNPGDPFARDARCDAPGARAGGLETVRWTQPTAGSYRVGVDFPETCDGAGEAQYRVLVDVGGRRREVTATARLLERVPDVVEFAVR
jgi:uncharacterized protein YfaP (DUF2135 family)